MDIDLETYIAEPKVTACMVPNGTGKTTTINLIKSAMSLEMYLEEGEDDVYGYKGEDNNAGFGSFELRMAIKEGASQRSFDVKIDFNFFEINEQKAARFSTRTSEDGWSTPGNPNPPEEIQMFINVSNRSFSALASALFSVTIFSACCARCQPLSTGN